MKRRLAEFDFRHLDGDVRAAVAVIFRSGAEGAEVLLIHRAEHPEDPWSGHVAFPGGRLDPGDANPFAASVRETEEEIGLDLAGEAEHFGRFSDLQAVAKGRHLGLVIEPFAFAIRRSGEQVFRLNHEVQQAFWMPLAFLVDGGHRSSLNYSVEGGNVQLPCYRWQGRVLWGLTLRILDEVVEILTGIGCNDWPAVAGTGGRRGGLR